MVETNEEDRLIKRVYDSLIYDAKMIGDVRFFISGIQHSDKYLTESEKLDAVMKELMETEEIMKKMYDYIAIAKDHLRRIEEERKNALQ